MAQTFFVRWLHRVRPRRRLRRLLRRLDRRRAHLPRVLVNGYPKGGTHLLQRCVSLLPGMVWEETWLPPQEAMRMVRLEEPHRPAAPTALREADRQLARLAPGEFLLAHFCYHPALAALLVERRVRSLLILRDPRDVVVSLLFHLITHADHPLHDYFTRTLRSDDERLLACITGFEPPPGSSLPRLEDAGTVPRHFLPWQQVPLNYTTRFERLVGPAGGGTAEAQAAEIRNIARHLGLGLTAAEVERVVAGLFGQGSPTFREGQIGSWKNYFKEEHKAALKRLAGQEMIDLGYEQGLGW